MRSESQSGAGWQRERISLDGTWEFRAELSGEGGRERPIEVPGAWQAQFEDLRGFSGRAIYRRSITVPSSWAGRTVRLCFGAVDYLCEVLVNGRPAGDHEGGYLPFWFDVTAWLRFGELNEITVVVIDVGPGDAEPVSFDEIPHGKQSWYGPLGGLWQSVFLESTAKTFVEHALIRPELASGAVSVDVRLGGPAGASDVLLGRAISPGGTQTWRGRPVELEPGATTAQLVLQVSDIEAWSPQTPALYGLEIGLSRNGELLDQWSDRFGFRSIATRDGALLLNGEPLYLLGALDQDYYLGTITTPPSAHLLRRQVLLAKELGLNCLRCHIKVPDPRYLRAADELGMLVWAELPNWNLLTEVTRKRARATFEGMVDRDFNHPSIVIWTVANESWGLDLSDESQRRWLQDAYVWATELDPTRLVVDNSACPPNFHLRSDLNDFHLYRAFPDHARSWRAWTQAWVADPSATYSPHGDAHRSGDEPLVLSEFGNWGLPDVFELRDQQGADPWWFQTGAERGDGVALPEGVLERFESWGLTETFGSWQDFVVHSQEHQFDALRESIWDLRSHREIAGYVITEFTDVHWEANGLLDMARNPKSYHHRFSQVNAEDVLILRPRHRRYSSGETVEFEVLVSHYSERDLSDFSVQWRMGGTEHEGTISGAVGRGDVAEAGRCSFEAPPVARPTILQLEAVLRDGGGRFVARAGLGLLLFPARRAASDLEVWTSVARQALGRCGWKLTADLESSSVAVAERWNSELADFVSAGGRAVILARDEVALPQETKLAVRARAGSRWEGDWAQGMGFLRPELHETLGTGPRVSSLFEGLTADHVVTGYSPADRTDILGGYYVGWLRDMAATVGVFRAGSGYGIVCTMPLLDGYGRDPLGTALLDRLIELAASPSLVPSMLIT
ncbi:MAG: glycoside hydrolase family 2 [Actinomycetota bacterium]|nr:glycoside hydrolase family 2 [Actinomycetota bacterium]